MISATIFFSFETVRHVVFAKLDHNTFEKCFKETVPSFIRDALDEKTKLAIENESINYNNTEPNPNDAVAVEAHKIPTEIHSCMLMFG